MFKKIRTNIIPIIFGVLIYGNFIYRDTEAQFALLLLLGLFGIIALGTIFLTAWEKRQIVWSTIKAFIFSAVIIFVFVFILYYIFFKL